MLNRLLLIVFLVAFSSCLYASAPFGKALYLDGNQQYFSIPDKSYLNVGNGKNLTLEFWFKPDSDESFNLVNKVLIGYDKVGWMRFQGWFAEINRSSTLFISDTSDITSYPPGYHPGNLFEGFHWPTMFRFIHGLIREDGSGRRSGSGSELKVLSNVWQHLAIRFNLGGTIKIFINGVSILSSRIKIDISSTGYALNIGGFHIAIDSTLHSSVYYKGFIDEVRIWNNARTDSEIISTMNDTLSSDYYLTPESGLIGYYRIDELENLGIGDDDLANDVRDLTYNANHGHIMGNAVLVDTDLLANVESDFSELPVSFDLLQNYPNPFNPETTISFNLPKSGFVTLKVYDILGQEIETLIKDYQQSGIYKISWNAGDLPSGLYICHLQTESFVKTLKMLLQK
jgi:hypothetical protein